MDTPRLRLDEITTKDIKAIHKLFTLPEVLEYHDLECLTDREQAGDIVHEFRARFDERTGIRWAIRLKKDSRLIGTCGFKSWDREMRSTELGYDLLPEYWGNGYATEAINAILKSTIFNDLPWGPLHRIQAETIPGNSRSESVLRKLGFKEEGVRRDAGYWKGRYHDLRCFGLIIK